MEETVAAKSRRERRKDGRLTVKKNKHHSWLQQQQEKKSTKARMVVTESDDRFLSQCLTKVPKHRDASFDQELDFTKNQDNEDVRLESFSIDHSPSPKVKNLKKTSKKRLTKFEEYLQQDIGKLSESAEADIKLERKLAKKLKVKDSLLGGVDDGMNSLFEDVPSILEEEMSIGRAKSTSLRKKNERVKQEHVQSVEQGDDENGDSAMVKSPSLGIDLENSPLEGHSWKKGRKRQHMRQDDDLHTGVNESDYVVTVSGVPQESSTLASLGGNVKYVAPHLRSHSGSESEERAQFRKRLRGLLNRLSESNAEFITGEVASIYSSVVRSVATEITIEEVLASCAGGPRGNEQYAALFASFVAGMACLVGLDFSAKLLALLANYFENEYLKEDNLSLRNLTLLLSYLCVFGVCSSDLIYDFMTVLSQRLTEIDVSTILTILECCGMRIRADDPTAMKNFVASVQNRANELKASTGEQKDINSKRMEFMLEAICDIKNNKKRTKEEPAPHTRIKKWLQKLGIENILLRGIKWSKLLDADKKGQWWLSGNVAMTTDVIAEVATTIDKENAEAQRMLQLASSQRMNTDARRAIFCIIMSGEDYIDSFEKLLRLDLPGKQDREIMRVLVECCLQEKVFNKYYVALASKLCEHDKNHKFTLQFCLWDHFKELDSMPLVRSMHLAKFVAEMLSSFNISVAVLKTVDLSDAGQLTPKRIMHFRMLFDAMFQYPDNLIWNVFTRIAVSPELEGLRHGIEYFIREHVVNADKALARKFKLLRKALYNIEGILM